MTGTRPETAMGTGDWMAQTAASRSVVAARHAFTDVDEQAAWIAEAYPQRYEQLGAGAFAGEMTKVDVGGVLVVRERVNRRLFQAGTSREFTLAWVLSPAMRYRCNGQDLGPQHIMVWEGGSEFEIVCDPSDMCTVTVSAGALADWNGYPLGAGHRAPFRGVRIVPLELADSLHTVVFRALDIVETGAITPNPALWRESLRDDLLQIATAVAELPLRDEQRLRRSKRTFERVVRLAREQIARDTAGSLTIDELCRRVGVSRRNLHYAFDAVLSAPPGQYLRCLRLNAARRALKRRDGRDNTVADVAFRLGFGHPSHFAADYKRRFGELPSETAQRSAAADSRPAERVAGL